VHGKHLCARSQVRVMGQAWGTRAQMEQRS
jgi:hypothetical protein